MISRDKAVLDLTKKLMTAQFLNTFNISFTFIVIITWYNVWYLLTETGFPLVAVDNKIDLSPSCFCTVRSICMLILKVFLHDIFKKNWKKSFIETVENWFVCLGLWSSYKKSEDALRLSLYVAHSHKCKRR
jgi:hypothetical protein